MKQYFLLLSFLFFFAAVSAQGRVGRKGVHPVVVGNGAAASGPAALFTIDQLNGKWQEHRRQNSSNSMESFMDTMLIFVNNGRGYIKSDESMIMTMQGPASIEPPATLAIAGDTYTIKKLNDHTLILADDNDTHILKRVSFFAFEHEGKDSIVPARYEIRQSVDLKSLSGKWQVYKREAKPGFITENTTLIKSLTLSGFNDDGSAGGEIVTYNGNNITQASPCTVSFSGGKLNIKSNGGNMQYDVYRADETEFIFGDAGGVMNYAKH